MIKKLLPWIGLILVAGQIAAKESPFRPVSTRSQALGMTWIATTAPEEAMILNPAWLGSEDERLTALRLQTSANQAGLDLLFGETGDLIKNFDSSRPGVIDRVRGLNAVYESGGPLFLSYKGEGFGLGLYSSSQGNFVVSKDPSPSVSLHHDFDLGAIAGLSLPITLDSASGQQLLIGGTIKYLIRIHHASSAVPLDQAGHLVDPLAFGGDFRIGQAIGSDLGLVWRTPYFSLGLVWYDWFGTALSWTEYSGDFKTKDTVLEDSRISPQLGLGVAWTPSQVLGLPSWLFSNTTLALDIRASLDGGESLLEMLHLGFETSLFYFLNLRLGLNGGYPACGLGILAFGHINLEYALFLKKPSDPSFDDSLVIHSLSLTLIF